MNSLKESKTKGKKYRGDASPAGFLQHKRSNKRSNGESTANNTVARRTSRNNSAGRGRRNSAVVGRSARHGRASGVRRGGSDTGGAGGGHGQLGGHCVRGHGHDADLGGALADASRQADLGNGGGDGGHDSRAGGGDGRAGLVGAGHDGGCGHDNSRSRNRGDRGCRSEVRGDGGAGGDGRVALGVGAAQALEVLDGLGDGLVRVAVGVQAVVDVGDKGFVRAVAGRVRVVDAAHNVVPGGDAGGHDAGVGQGGGGGRGARDDAAGGNDDDGRRAGLLLGGRRGDRRGRGGLDDGWWDSASLCDGVAGSEDRGLCSSNGADGGRHSNNNGGHDGALALGASRAVSDGRSAGRDCLDAGGVDSRRANEAGEVRAASLVGGGVGGDSLAGAGAGRSRLGHGRVGGGGGLDNNNLGGRRRQRRQGGGDGAKSRCGRGHRSRLSSRRGLGVRGRGSVVNLGGGGSRRRRLGLCGCGRGLGGLGHRAGGRATGKRNRGHADGASRRGLGDVVAGLAGRVDDSDVGGTAALGVLDSRALGRAVGALLAGGAVGHAVLELELARELGVDVDGFDREGRDVFGRRGRRRRRRRAAARVGTASRVRARGRGRARARARAAADGRRRRSIVTARGGNDLLRARRESAARHTLGVSRLAGPAAEVEAAPAGEGASAEVGPRPARLLVRVALVVGVAWAVVAGSIVPAAALLCLRESLAYNEGEGSRRRQCVYTCTYSSGNGSRKGKN